MTNWHTNELFKIKEQLTQEQEFVPLAHYKLLPWTPIPLFGGGNTGMAYTTSNAFCRFFRDHVEFCGRIVFTAKGTSLGQFQIGGLPYNALAVGAAGGSTSFLPQGMAALVGDPYARISGGTNVLLFQQFAATGFQNVTEVNLTDTTLIDFRGSYEVDPALLYWVNAKDT